MISCIHHSRRRLHRTERGVWECFQRFMQSAFNRCHLQDCILLCSSNIQNGSFKNSADWHSFSAKRLAFIHEHSMQNYVRCEKRKSKVLRIYEKLFQFSPIIITNVCMKCGIATSLDLICYLNRTTKHRARLQDKIYSWIIQPVNVNMEILVLRTSNLPPNEHFEPNSESYARN